MQEKVEWKHAIITAASPLGIVLQAKVTPEGGA